MDDPLAGQRAMGDRRQRVLGSLLFAREYLDIDSFEEWNEFIRSNEIPFAQPTEATYETINEWADEWDQAELDDAMQFFMNDWRQHRRSMK